VPDVQPMSPVPSWRSGHFVWPTGRTKIVLFGGVGSRTGDAERSFAGLIKFLVERGGYELRRDILEGTYAGDETARGWQPKPYGPSDTRRPLLDMAEAAAGCLAWYRDRLPAGTTLYVLGYSLGGVVGLDGATLAVVRDRTGWRSRLAGVVTLAAPVRGCNAGPFINWAWLVTSEVDPLGAAGRDLDVRWNDAEEQKRLKRRADFLRAGGTTVLTLADPNDAVVRPDEALLPGPGERDDDLLVPVRVSRPGSLGHGALLDEPDVWRRILRLVGPQARADEPADDHIDAELEAIKKRLRAQGRIK
jgi:hypothetical protein